MITFRSPTDASIHLSLTSGHTAVVTPEGTDLAQPFHEKAVAAGAVPVSGRSQSPALKAMIMDRQLTIKEAVVAMASSGKRGDLLRDGSINLQALIDHVGFPVFQEEVDALLAEVRASATSPAARVVDPLLAAP